MAKIKNNGYRGPDGAPGWADGIDLFEGASDFGALPAIAAGREGALWS